MFFTLFSSPWAAKKNHTISFRSLSRHDPESLEDEKEGDKEESIIDSAELEDIIASTLELTDDTGRLLSPPFRVLVSEEVTYGLKFYILPLFIDC